MIWLLIARQAMSEGMQVTVSQLKCGQQLSLDASSQQVNGNDYSYCRLCSIQRKLGIDWS